MSFTLPWESPDIRAVITAFGCKVVELVPVAPKIEKHVVVWRDHTTGETHIQDMTEKEYWSLIQQLEQYDIGVIVGSEWDTIGLPF